VNPKRFFEIPTNVPGCGEPDGIELHHDRLLPFLHLAHELHVLLGHTTVDAFRHLVPIPVPVPFIAEYTVGIRTVQQIGSLRHAVEHGVVHGIEVTDGVLLVLAGEETVIILVDIVKRAVVPGVFFVIQDPVDRTMLVAVGVQDGLIQNDHIQYPFGAEFPCNPHPGRGGEHEDDTDQDQTTFHVNCKKRRVKVLEFSSPGATSGGVFP